MYTFLITLFIIVSLLMVVVILMQSSKGGGLAGTFGGPGSSTFFGGRGVATFLSKLTSGLAIAFFVLAFLITLTSGPKKQVRSIVKSSAEQMSPAAGLPVPAGAPTEMGESPITNTNTDQNQSNPKKE